MKIKEVREQLGLSRPQVNKLIGVPVRTLENWEMGKRTCPEYIEKLIVDKLLQLAEKSLTSNNN